MQSELNKIKELHEKDMAASKTKDLAVLVSLCTDDCIMIPPDEDPIIGKEAIKLWIQRNLEQERDYQITEYVHDFKEVNLLGDWAFEWGTFSGTAQPKTGGTPIRSTGKLFRILKQQSDGSWKIARSIWNNDSSPAVDEESFA